MNSSISLEPKDRIREERKRLGLRQEDAAEKCSLSRSMWIRYENGQSVMDGAALRAFTALGADAGYILNGIRSDAFTQGSNLAIAEFIKSDASPEQQQLADATILENAQRMADIHKLKQTLADVASRLSKDELIHVIQTAEFVRKAGVLDSLRGRE